MFAIVDVNNFYASCERLFRPDLWGKPIVVLSNNDGCVIARSSEAKSLGIKMGAPYFQVKAFCQQHKVAVFSSNYALYGDISRRIMSTIEEVVPEMEVYSIDEAFLKLSGFGSTEAKQLGEELVNRIQRHVGIPVSIGLGPSKTLAKVANYIGKQHVEQPVFSLASTLEQIEWLPHVPVREVWGIGWRCAKRLEAANITTAWGLRMSDTHTLRKQFSVVMERTIRELNGSSCLELEEPTPRRAICSAKSFGTKQTEFEPIAEALSSYAARACEKLRQQGSIAGYVQVVLKTSRHAPITYNQATGRNLVNPTADTREIISQAKACLRAIYQPGIAYQKVGILLADLQPSSMQQNDLFSTVCDTKQEKSVQVMQLLDSIQSRYGKKAIKLAAEGTKQPWQLQCNYRSPRYTTNLKEVVRVRA